MKWDKTTELNETCKRCGEAVILILYENHATCNDPGSSEVEEYTCDCGAEVEHEAPGVGIKELIEDTRYEFDNYGYLIDCNFEEYGEGTHVSFNYIKQNYFTPSPEIIYFIKGKRPPKFDCFRLWDGTLIEQGE